MKSIIPPQVNLLMKIVQEVEKIAQADENPRQRDFEVVFQTPNAERQDEYTDFVETSSGLAFVCINSATDETPMCVYISADKWYTLTTGESIPDDETTEAEVYIGSIKDFLNNENEYFHVGNLDEDYAVNISRLTLLAEIIYEYMSVNGKIDPAMFMSKIKQLVSKDPNETNRSLKMDDPVSFN